MENNNIQLSLYDHSGSAHRQLLLNDINLIMNRPIREFLIVPRSLEKLEYIRDFLKAYKKGGLALVESEGLEVGGPQYKLTEKYESILSELLSKSKAQPSRGTPGAGPTNPKKT